jgi:hypothetical protein
MVGNGGFLGRDESGCDELAMFAHSSEALMSRLPTVNGYSLRTQRNNLFATAVRQRPLRNSSSNHVARSFKEPRRGYELSVITAFARHVSIAARNGYAYRTVHSLGWRITSCVTVCSRLVPAQIFARNSG